MLQSVHIFLLQLLTAAYGSLWHIAAQCRSGVMSAAGKET